jgi:mannose-6-phosphate isomerase-like protein (cupin superfamily)
MPVLSRATAPTFQLAGALFTGLAAPSRGSRETSVWRVRLDPGTPAAQHSLDHEEILVAIAGRAVAHFDHSEQPLETGDAVLVPAHQPFSLANPFDSPFEAIAVLPVGARATMTGSEPFIPPWTV